MTDQEDRGVEDTKGREEEDQNEQYDQDWEDEDGDRNNFNHPLYDSSALHSHSLEISLPTSVENSN